MDEEGYMFFKARSKELVIRGGVNIYPMEIETFLRTHPQILDVSVVGVPDERFDEELCAWVKLKPAEALADVQAPKLTEASLKEFCKDKIAYFKVPKYVKFVNEFPMNNTGKVQKFKMQAQMIKELGLDKITQK